MLYPRLLKVDNGPEDVYGTLFIIQLMAEVRIL